MEKKGRNDVESSFVVIFAPPARKNSKRRKKEEREREREIEERKRRKGKRERRKEKRRKGKECFCPEEFPTSGAPQLNGYDRVEIVVTCTWRLLNREACIT